MTGYDSPEKRLAEIRARWGECLRTSVTETDATVWGSEEEREFFQRAKEDIAFLLTVAGKFWKF